MSLESSCPEMKENCVQERASPYVKQIVEPNETMHLFQFRRKSISNTVDDDLLSKNGNDSSGVLNRWRRRMSLNHPIPRVPLNASTESNKSINSDTTTSSTTSSSNSVVDVQPDKSMNHSPCAPMSRIPSGTDLGFAKPNSWDIPPCHNFKVRGTRYLHGDRKKVASSEFLFPLLGCEVFLTQDRPKNVAANPFLLGGTLRHGATFCVNFRLPWAILVFYFEIPQRFVPYVRAGHEADMHPKDKERLAEMIPSMSAADRCVCRYLMNDSDYKNKTLKIVPMVIRGPWVVRQVAGGKPAIIGNVLPVNYIYQRADANGHLYLEADLDIASSAAARGILNVAKAHAHCLTLDLGFVVQANKDDELPEQMLMGCRLHAINPGMAPAFPDEADADAATETALTMSLSEQETASDPETTSDDDDSYEGYVVKNFP